LNDNANRSIELIFIYAAGGDEKYAEAAEMCAGFYNRRPGVKAQAVGVQ